MQIKIFHTADLHIGMKFRDSKYNDDVREKLIEARFSVLGKMIQTANEQKCELFVIAGDLFDSKRVAKKDRKKVASFLNAFDGEAILFLPGNHDFIDDEDDEFHQYLIEQINKDIFIPLWEPKKMVLEIGEHKVAIYPGPCNAKESSENAIGWIKEETIDDDLINIGIAHGAIEGISPDNEAKYFKMTREELQHSGLDFWLLGHSHIQLVESFHNKPLFFMPSTPEPDGLDCKHSGNAFIITVDENKNITYDSVQTGSYKFRDEQLTINSIAYLNTFAENMEKDSPEFTLLRLRVSGRLPDEEKKNIATYKNRLEHALALLIFNDETELDIDKAFIEKEFSKDSVPYKLLTNLMDADKPCIVNTTYDLIKEVRS